MSDTPQLPAGEPPSSPGLAPINIEEEMRASYLDYAMSVIIGRALPDVRDGLKPVHRRVLFAMQDLGNTHSRAYKKSARIVGDVIGKYHPHGDQAVYDTLVRMAQDFSMRHVLVDGQGNFGSVDGDPPAAMRYTEVRMARLASEMLVDIDKDTVDFGDNYDASLREPLVLPNRLPNLLINGSSGIAVGMATNIPPHNLAEVIDATVALIGNPDLTSEQLMRWIPGPDFPTGGLLFGAQGLRAGYAHGRGSIQVRGRASVESGKRGERVVITEIPYQVNKAALIEKIAHLVRDKRLMGISDIRDESDRDGMRVVVEIKRDAHGEVVLNQLYASTALQSSFGINMVAIVDGSPQILSLAQMVGYFVDHRRDVVVRRCRFELAEAHKRFNIVFGLLAAIDSIDRIIELVRGAVDPAAAKLALQRERLGLSDTFVALMARLFTFHSPHLQRPGGDSLQLNEAQAQAILEMRLSRLTGLERDKLAEEGEGLRQTIERLDATLASDARLMQVIVDELMALRAAYASPRRTELTADAGQMSAEDLIADAAMVVTVSHAGYIKRNPTDLYQAQHRGGRGKTAATTRNEDFVESVFVASAHQYLLVFTDRGRVFWLKVHEIPQAGRASRGRPLVNLVRVEGDERVTAVLPVRAFSAGSFVVMATAMGVVKKVDLMSFARSRAQGLAAISLDEGDHLIRVALTDGARDILLATRMGLATRFQESQLRPMGRTARGVRGIRLARQGDRVVGMVICDEGAQDLLIVCDNGFGKRTALADFPAKGRGGQGVTCITTSRRNGQVASVVGVVGGDEVMVVTHRGMMIRTSVDAISRTGRIAQGVRIISTQADEQVAAVARLSEAPAGEVDALPAEGAPPVEGDAADA